MTMKELPVVIKSPDLEVKCCDVVERPDNVSLPSCDGGITGKGVLRDDELSMNDIAGSGC